MNLKKVRKEYLAVLTVIVIVAIFAVSFLMITPENLSQCQQDDDCTTTLRNSCDTVCGYRDTPINKNFRDLWESKVSFLCPIVRDARCLLSGGICGEFLGCLRPLETLENKCEENHCIVEKTPIPIEELI